ncbi:MAG: GTP-binding protein [Candidatus Lokiarchaeia archaeon]|nr:GTP-binding protein [Candidatus Lokiarchaeia archaeon]
MPEFSFKIILIGPPAVGKTSLLNRFVHNEFDLSYKLTIGVDFLTKTLEYEPSNKAKLQIWDIGAQERFKFLHRSYYDGAFGALVVFDLSRQQTFSGMKTWISEMHSILADDIPKVIIGNKSDLISDIGQVVDKNEVKEYSENQKSIYIETSAKTGENVEKAFKELTLRMVERMRKIIESSKDNL